MARDPAMHLPALTGVRGIAAWWVVLYHFRDLFAGLLPAPVLAVLAHGYLAVDLFFVLSGFVIWLNYAESVRRPDRAAVRRFLVARLARIYPLHLAIAVAFLANPLALMLFSSSGAAGTRYDPAYWLASLLLVQNWALFDDLAWNIPAWSISTEWFAYLLFPLMVAAAPQRRSPAAALALLALLLALVAGYFHLAGAPSLGDDIARLGLGRCVLEFAAGAALCRLWQCGLGPGARRLGAAVAAVGAALYVGGTAPDWAVLPAACAGLILALTGPGTGLARLLGAPALLWLGEISYSTYLVHYLIKDWIKFTLYAPGQPALPAAALYVGVTLAASALLFHAVEKPGQRLLRRWAGGARTADLPAAAPATAR